jgi:hypothetical protein
MFDLLGALLGLYVVYAIANGAVHAKRGPWGETVSRTQSPEYFWTVIAIYAALSVALIAWF